MCYSKYNSNQKPYLKLNPDCDNDMYDAEIVEEFVVNSLMEFAVKYSDEIKKKSISVDDITSKLSEEYERLEGQYQRALKAYTVLGDEKLLEQAQETTNIMKRLGREIEVSKEKKKLSTSIEDRINMLRTLPDMWKEMTAKQKQNVIRELVERIEIKNGDIKIFLYKNKYNDLSFIKNI